MAKFIMVLFLGIGSLLSYFTYNGVGQESVETLQKEQTVRSNSYHGSSSSGSGSSYNSSSYSYGK